MSQIRTVIRMAGLHYPPPRTDHRLVVTIFLCRVAVLVWVALVALGLTAIAYLTYLWAAAQ